MRRSGVLFVLFLSICSCGVLLGATFTVNTNDGAKSDIDPGDGVCLTTSGECSLRAAVMESNAFPADDTIAFAIAGGGAVATITPTLALPVIVDPVVIDGLTQGCPAPGPCIELVGTLIPNDNGLEIAAGHSTVRGLAIGSFVDGVRLTGGDENVIQSNHIGTDASGTVPRGNLNGITILTGSTNNLIGGTTPESGNRIAANTEDGIDIRTANNVILSNVIGGDTAIPESLFNLIGIRVTIAGGQVIGAPGAGNVVSGNSTGIWLAGSNVSGNLVQSNCIGPIAGCTLPFGNLQRGISVFSSPGNTIGGTEPGEGNVVGSNDIGISISLDFADDNLVVGNFIGTDASGDPILGNGVGVLVASGANDNVIGGFGPGAGNVITLSDDSGIRISNDADDNRILGNTISLNSEHGIEISAGVNNTIQGNAISFSGELGIELGNDGVTPNDSGDFDAGPNHLQNYPELDWAVFNGDATYVIGVLDSTPDSAFELEFFAGDFCDQSGHGEGERALGTSIVMTDSSGLAPFTLSFPIDVEGQVVTATATNSAGSTSEFSSCVTVLFNEGPGACCLSGGGCISIFEFACNGVYQGHGTTCDTVTCDGGVPAVSDRGMMLLAAALLALLTAVVISRRRRSDPSSRIPH